MPSNDPLPEVRRVSFHDHAHAVAAEIVGDPDRVGQVAAEACRLPPLQRIQTAFDQLVGHADTHRAGGLGPYGHDFAGYVQAELDGARRHVDILMTAAAAGQAMMQQMTGQLQDLEVAMAKKKGDDEAPKLTTGGEPHPLQTGGYDPNSDPQLSGNVSDVEALKEGKTTHAQAEALAKADAKGDEGAEPAKSDEADMKPKDASVAPTAASKGSTAHLPPADDDDAPKRGKGKR